MRTTSLGAALAAFVALLASAFPVPASAQQDVAADGFALVDVPYPGQRVAATLSNGDVVAFDGATIGRYDASGALLVLLGAFDPPVFTGAFAIDPSETFALVGESTNGDLFRVDLAGAGMALLTNLYFNYDADFESATTAIVSAATGGFFTGNDLVRVDTTTGATQVLAHVSGPSGPVDVDRFGNLWYATQDPVFPPAAGTTDVVFFTAAQLAGGVLLGDADAFTFSSGFDGGSSLAEDETFATLYMTEASFDLQVNRVRAIGSSPALSAVLVEGDPLFFGASIERRPGDGIAIFRPYQPVSGGALVWAATDFAGTSTRRRLEPARPLASVSGPGTSGAGPVTFDLAGAAPNGTFLLLYGLQSTYGSLESAVLFQNVLPLFTGLDLGTLAYLPLFLPIDANGAGSLPFENPGFLQGLVVLQALVCDASGKPFGTSTAAFL